MMFERDVRGVSRDGRSQFRCSPCPLQIAPTPRMIAVTRIPCVNLWKPFFRSSWISKAPAECWTEERSSVTCSGTIAQTTAGSAAHGALAFRCPPMHRFRRASLGAEAVQLSLRNSHHGCAHARRGHCHDRNSHSCQPDPDAHRCIASLSPRSQWGDGSGGVIGTRLVILVVLNGGGDLR